MTDEQAMWRVQMEGCPEAFAELMGRWQAPIQQLCVRMTGDPQRGEDLTQEAFARVFSRRQDFQQNSRFSTWLWRIALNLCYDELRRRRRRNEQPLETGDGEAGPELRVFAPPPDEELAAKEQAALVRDALQRLPDRHREVLVLRHYEHLKFHEIAEVLQIPEGTVKSRMAEGLALLARKLKPALRDAGTPMAGSAMARRQNV